VIEGFVVDFYCHKLKLGIELDGGIHDFQKEYDQARQHAIEAENVAIIRVENGEVMLDINILLDKIRQVWESFYNR
jgi:very-short-patch-repair endonuclease